MSYCRWSSDDFMCDLYCYEDVGGGYTTHVAGRRPVYKEPLPAPIEFTKENLPAWYARHQQVMRMHEDAELRPIGLPYDGESFNDPTLETFLDRLLALRVLGYQFPDDVIQTVIEEIREQGNDVVP